MNLKFLIIPIILIQFYTISADTGKEMSITVKEAQVRTSSSFLGKVIYKLDYTDRVTVLSERAGWSRIFVDNNHPKGWVHSSSLTDKKLTLKKSSGNIETNVSDNEVALAGKGFNKQLEVSYRSKNNADYTWIDKMESNQIDVDELLKFIGGVYDK